MTRVEQPVALICVFIWIGAVGAISFLEAWLKFRAPGVTLGIGLGIGRLVFNALNKIEWVFMSVVLLSSIWYKLPLFTWLECLPVAVLGILALQTWWLLPLLDERALLRIAGKEVSPVPYHLYFVLGEIFKMGGLILYGIGLFKQS